jgi:hypothetical protein
MTPRIQVSAIAVAAACALSSCATKPPLAGSTLACPGKDCSVPVVQNVPFGALDFPEYVDVNVAPGDTLTVTWKLSSMYGTVFRQRGGIEFADAQRFSCMRDPNSAQTYTCTGRNLQPKTKYKYTIRPDGLAAGWPHDPYIQNN